jgi:hypothetical protein
MKQGWILPVLLGAVALWAGDGTVAGEPQPEEAVTLKWHTGVFGTSMGYADQQPYYGAVRFTPGFGCTLSLVRWYQSGDAATAHVFVWAAGTEDAPGALLEQYLVSSTGEEAWHEVAVPNSHRFPAEQDFWVGVRLADYTVGGGKYPFGADAGPQYPPKRSLYASRDGITWYHISPPPSQYDRNWLLEAVVQVESLTGVTADESHIVTPRLVVGPNPLAGGWASVRYSLPKAGPVSISVFDVAGRCVHTHSTTSSPNHSVALDLRGLSAGVYLVRLDAKGFSRSQKLVVQQ